MMPVIQFLLNVLKAEVCRGVPHVCCSGRFSRTLIMLLGMVSFGHANHAPGRSLINLLASLFHSFKLGYPRFIFLSRLIHIMSNFCQNFHKRQKKMLCLTLLATLIWNWSPPAENLSARLNIGLQATPRLNIGLQATPKFKGKLVLVGILSGLAYLTRSFVARDKRAVETLQHHLGPPEHVIQFERGFDRWRVHCYAAQCYLFRNNRFIQTKTLKTFLLDDALPDSIAWLGWKAGQLEEKREEWKKRGKGESMEERNTLPHFQPSAFSPFLTYTPVLGNPRWLPLSLWHPPRALQSVSSCLYLSGDGRLPLPVPWLLR